MAAGLTTTTSDSPEFTAVSITAPSRVEVTLWTFTVIDCVNLYLQYRAGALWLSQPSL